MMRHSLGIVLSSVLLIQACEAARDTADPYAAATGGENDPQVVQLKNYQEALALFDELNYTAAAWQSGVREVPRIYLAEIHDRWAKVTAQEIDVNLKKRLFFRAIGPLALRANELIMEDRQKLLAMQEPSAADRAWLTELATAYGLDPAAYASPMALRQDLLLRVDIVPPSLTLAQAAEESGWGTSRFAFTGNALFGQWTWGGKGMRPAAQRSGKGDYKIAAFDAPLQSVESHARNLNSHKAYREFRQRRAALRADDQRVSGLALVDTLTSYSERGADYVKSLRGIITFNKLDPVDDAYLGDTRAIVLIDPDL